MEVEHLVSGDVYRIRGGGSFYPWGELLVGGEELILR